MVFENGELPFSSGYGQIERGKKTYCQRNLQLLDKYEDV